MTSIVTDYKKCEITINSCITKVQLLNCDNLIRGFEQKHRSDRDSWKLYKELNKLITLNLGTINSKKLLELN